MNTSIANKAMLRFAEEYARANGYLEGWVSPDTFWGNAYDKAKNPNAPQVIRVSYVAPVFEDEKENLGYWSIPRIEIDSYFGHPRISVVDREKNFCCLSYDRETNEFKEGQFWRKDGLGLASLVKNSIELHIRRMNDGLAVTTT